MTSIGHDESRRPGLLRRFWLGECSLAFSYWVMGWLVNIGAVLLLSGMIVVLRRQTYNPYQVMGALAAIWGLLAGAQVYLSVGIWRSARAYRKARASQSKNGLWGIAAQTMVVLSVAGLAVVLVRHGAAELGEGWRMAFRGDPDIPPYYMRLMNDDTEAEIAGGFKYGLSRDAERLFAAAPRLAVLHLNSGGGRLGEAIELAKLIRARGLITYTSASCSSACTIAYMAGRERYLKLGAKIGFHRAAFAGAETTREMAELLAAAGVGKALVDRAVAQPASSLWYPSDQELRANHVITATVGAYRYAASGLGLQPNLDDFRAGLRRVDAFEAMELADRRTFDDSAELYEKLYVQGMSEGRIADEIRSREFAPLLRTRLVTSVDALQVEFAGLLADEFEALGAKNGDLCFEVATRGSTAQAVAALPADLQRHELDLSLRVLRDGERRKASTDIQAKEASLALSAQLAAKIGVDGMRLLMAPASVPASQHGLFCQLSVAMFRTIAQLPPRQAGTLMSDILAGMAKPQAAR